MLTLKEWMELVDYKITEGSDYYTNIPGLYSLSAWNEEQDGWSFFIAFDPRDNQRVYCVEVCDYFRKRAYRLKDPSIVLDKDAWDECEFVDLDVDDDFIQKALAIKAGEDYDTRVQIQVEFSDEELLRYMTVAHQQDITFNQLIEQAIVAFIEQSRKDGEL